MVLNFPSLQRSAEYGQTWMFISLDWQQCLYVSLWTCSDLDFHCCLSYAMSVCSDYVNLVSDGEASNLSEPASPLSPPVSPMTPLDQW